MAPRSKRGWTTAASALVCTVLCACARAPAMLAPRPTAVQPAAAYTGSEVQVIILGEHFDPTAVQHIGRGGGLSVDAAFRAFLGGTELRDVRWEATDRLTATVPGGLAGGPFPLRVVGPTGEGTLNDAFRGSLQRPAALSASLSTAAVVEVGGQIAVDAVASNAGELAALQLAVQLDPGGLRLLDAPPVPQQIGPGQAVRLQWHLAADARGAVQLALHAVGTDAFSGAPLAANAATSVSALAPPALAVVARPAPALVSVGQAIDLAAEVTNTGDVNARGVAFAAPSVSGTGAFVLAPAPVPQDVPAGATRTFPFGAQASARGLVSFAATGSGSDALTGAAVSGQAAWGPVVVQTPAQLAVFWLTVPGSVAPGQSFTASLGVINQGEARARGVRASPDPPTVTGTGHASGATAQGPVELPGAGYYVFKWTYTNTDTAPGPSLQLQTGATGSDANSGASLSAAPSPSPAIAVQTLAASLTVGPALLRGDPFTVALQVTNGESVAINSLTPSALQITGTAAVVCGSTSPSSANLLPGASVTFTWPCTSSGPGTLQLSASATGTEAGPPNATRSAQGSASAGVVELLPVAANPLRDGTAIANVVGHANRVYIGPRANGAGAARFQPDLVPGSQPENVAFSFAGEANDANASQPPFPSLGFTGCQKNTSQCGPDNEDGRGFFGSASVAGVPWLLAGGARTNGLLGHVYATIDATASPSFPYVDLSSMLAGGTLTTSAMAGFGSMLLLGFGSLNPAKPVLLAFTAMPAPPGLVGVAGKNAFDLHAELMPGVGASANVSFIDALAQLGGLLHVFNNGGCARAMQADPTAPTNSWLSCTPGALAYAAKTSTTTSKTTGLTPADRAFPTAVSYGGRLYAGRNTTAGPQLWSCAPGLSGACDPTSWSLVAGNGSGDTQLTQFNDPASQSVTLLAATTAHLFVGFDSPGGAVIWRSGAAAPAARADFQMVGPPGLGVSATRIFDAKALTFSGRESVYAAVGDGTSPVQIVRLAP